MIAAIQSGKLSVRFGDKVILDELSIRVNQGECLVLTGANGAGKSTLLLGLSGQLPGVEGELFLLGRRVQADSSYAKRVVGYLPAQPYLPNYLTPIEFLHLAAALGDLTKQEALRRIVAGVEKFVMHSELRLRIETLSTGMKQKLALAAMFVLSPKILLLDEPTLALDESIRGVLSACIQETLYRGGAAVIATHEPDEFLRLDKAIYATLSAGQLRIREQWQSLQELRLPKHRVLPAIEPERYDVTRLDQDNGDLHPGAGDSILLEADVALSHYRDELG